MKFNENTIKGKWLEIKGEIQKSWGKLTDDEIDKTQGDLMNQICIWAIRSVSWPIRSHF